MEVVRQLLNGAATLFILIIIVAAGLSLIGVFISFGLFVYRKISGREY